MMCQDPDNDERSERVDKIDAKPASYHPTARTWWTPEKVCRCTEKDDNVVDEVANHVQQERASACFVAT